MGEKSCQQKRKSKAHPKLGTFGLKAGSLASHVGAYPVHLMLQEQQKSNEQKIPFCAHVANQPRSPLFLIARLTGKESSSYLLIPIRQAVLVYTKQSVPRYHLYFLQKSNWVHTSQSQSLQTPDISEPGGGCPSGLFYFYLHFETAIRRHALQNGECACTAHVLKSYD